MRVTIIKHDNAVAIDGVRYRVDTRTMPVNVAVVQWDGIAGEIEYSHATCDHCGVRGKKPNEVINSLTPYQTYVDAWNIADENAKEAAAKAADELAAKIATAEQERAAHAAGQKS